uniref:Uncharacterized protein n=1 Tax=Cacopsylla melanoneura TaxID=428564 RepID=A0A8D8WG07_9HEMI
MLLCTCCTSLQDLLSPGSVYSASCATCQLRWLLSSLPFLSFTATLRVRISPSLICRKGSTSYPQPPRRKIRKLSKIFSVETRKHVLIPNTQLLSFVSLYVVTDVNKTNGKWQQWSRELREQSIVKILLYTLYTICTTLFPKKDGTTHSKKSILNPS